MVLQNLDFSYVFRNIKPFVLSKNFRFMSLHRMGVFDDMPDKEYLEKLWKAVMGYRLDLEHPTTFNEKIQWLKLYDRNPLYHTLVDKVAVKDWVAEKIGEQYIIPTLGVWNDPDDIDFDSLPNQFVLKCNHNSGKGMYICKDKTQLDVEKVKSDLREGLAQNYFLPYREWAYKGVEPLILAEKFIPSISGDLADYKLMVFNGEVKCLFTCTERFSDDGLKVTFFDRNWNIMNFERTYPASKKIIQRPNSLEKMIELAEELAKGIRFVRVDFYESENKPLFGELTLYPGTGLEKFNDIKYDQMIGSWLEL